MGHGQIPEAQDLLEGAEGPDVEGEDRYDQIEDAQGDKTAQRPEDHPFEKEGNPDEQVPGPDQLEDLDFIFPGHDIELDDVGDDEDGGQDEDPAQEKPHDLGQPAQRAHPVHPFLVELDVRDALDAAHLGNEGRCRLGPNGLAPELHLQGRREGIVLEVGQDIPELGEVSPEPLEGLFGADSLDFGDDGKGPDPPFDLVFLGLAGVPGQVERDDHVGGELFGQVLEVVREREEDAQDQEGQADDHDREDVPGPVLPQAVGRDRDEVLQLLENERPSFPMSFPF